MALYPPMTDLQLRRINSHLMSIQALRVAVQEFELFMVANNDDVDQLSLAIGRFRGRLAALDLEAFGTWKLIGSIREESFPVTPSAFTHSPPQRKQSASSLAELLK